MMGRFGPWRRDQANRGTGKVARTDERLSPELSPTTRKLFSQRHVFKLLLLSLLPLLFFALAFQVQLKREQEAALRQGYADNAAYLMRTVDTRLDETRDVLINLGRNQGLQRLIYPLGDAGRSGKATGYLSTLEAYIWYHLSSERSGFSDIRIYGQRVTRPIGYFIHPAEELPAELLQQWQSRAAFTELFYAEGQAGFPQDGLYFVHAISPQQSRGISGYIVAKLNMERLLSPFEASHDRVPFGFELRLGQQLLSVQDPRGQRAPLVDVQARGRYPDMHLTLLVPSRKISLNLLLPLAAFALSTLIALFIAYGLVLSLRRMTAEIDAKRQHIEALKLTALRSQINPHFLYNILSSINWKAKYAGLDEISDAVTDLSQFYRLSLNHGRETLRLKDEFCTIDHYLKLKTKLMDAPPTFSLSLPAELENKEIVNFILQPLVENAVVHGLAGLDRPCQLEVAAAGRGNWLWLWVLDDGRGLRVEDFQRLRQEESYGLRNVDSRIRLHCAADSGLHLFSQGQHFSFSGDLPRALLDELPEELRRARAKAESQGCLALLVLHLAN